MPKDLKSNVDLSKISPMFKRKRTEKDVSNKRERLFKIKKKRAIRKKMKKISRRKNR